MSIPVHHLSAAQAGPGKGFGEGPTMLCPGEMTLRLLLITYSGSLRQVRKEIVG